MTETRKNRFRLWAPWPVVLATTACSPLVPQLPPPLEAPAGGQPATLTPTPGAARELRVEVGPKAPVTEGKSGVPTAAPVQATEDPMVAAVNLQQVPLPQFVQLLYAEVLKKNVNLHASVLQRQEPVTFRTGVGQTVTQVEQAARLLLKSYGLSAVDIGGLVRVLPDNAAYGDLPVLRYGSVEAPASLRPVFQLVTLQAVRTVDVKKWLDTMFGERVTVMEEGTRNALLLRGNPDNMAAALEAISTLDQPAMRGRSSLSLSPVYWSATELAARLQEVLTAEGYAVQPVSSQAVVGGIRYPVILLPVPALNRIYVFTNSDETGRHVAEWARNLDRPGDRAIGKNFFTYTVQHKDAEALALTLDRVLGGASAATSAAGATAAAPAAPGGASRLSSVVVDKATNTLIFQTKPEDFAQLSSLLQTLDRPAKSALIEVTVAELTLSDEVTTGVDLLSSHIEANGGYKLSTSGGGGSTASVNFSIFNGANIPRVAISALASDNRGTILSSPRVMARNGESALIQVGQEVPVLSQQQSTGLPGTGNTGLLQTVQYRSTGVILRIKPVIHSGDQVDLEVSQEVSEALKTDTGVSASPTFGTRKIETKMTLRNGSTVLLGGLISNVANDNNGGVPLLKDIPVLGKLFSRQSRTGRRTELVIFITPYIANDSHDAEALTDAFRKQLGGWATGAKPAAAEASKP